MGRTAMRRGRKVRMQIMKSRKMIIGLLAGLLVVAGIVVSVLLFVSQSEKQPIVKQDDNGKKEQTEERKVWLLDFSNYKGENLDPNGYLSIDVAEGKNYTFSFDYCVVGESLSTSVINAAQAWGLGSNVEFQDGNLQGKGSYTTSFTADWPYLYPVFQSHIPMGAPKLYIWNLQLKREGDDRNLISYVTLNHWKGDLATEGLISLADIDPDTLEGTLVEIPENPVWRLDFNNYEGDNSDPGAHISAKVEEGASYTFSFDYCVVGETTGLTVINAAKDWGMGSNVAFTNNRLQGKGTYTITFTADYPKIYPVFQCHTPRGTAELYLWNISLVKEGTEKNLFDKLVLKSFGGDLAETGLISIVDVDTSTLKGTTVKTYENPTWLFDFAGYKGDEKDPNAYLSIDVEVGSTYTFSFDYCVEGESLGTKVINAARDWEMGSNVAFADNRLTGKGSYTTTFTADYPKLYPVFQTHMPYGAPKLYVWNIKLVKAGESANLLKDMTKKSFLGTLVDAQLASITDIDPATLKGTTVKTYTDPVWLFDFAGYQGSEQDPCAFMPVDLNVGSTYTLSFDYCVDGKSTGTTVINAAKDWQNASKVGFTNNRLTGKGSYSFTFTADHTQIIPVFQTHMPYGGAKLYVWNMKLVKSGDDTNLFKDITSKSFRGTLVEAGLASIVDIDTDSLKGTEPDPTPTPDPDKPEVPKYIGGNTWLMDFAAYQGEQLTPNTHFTVNVDKDAKYTFSFKYCVIGKSTGTKVINAAKEWGLGSAVAFDNNSLTGKGEYKTTFTADMGQVIPVFETHTPYGAPQLYVWDIQLVKEGTEENLLAGETSDKFKGDLTDAKLVTLSDVDTEALKPTESGEETKTRPVWLFDFASYKGTEADPGAYSTITVEKGAEYTFSFGYCVDGHATKTTVINAKQAWGLGSTVAFTDNKLTGKGTYTFTFTADTDQVIPVFQTNVSNGTPKLYVWDMKLVKTGSEDNLLASKTIDDFQGVMKNENLIHVEKMDPDTLEPSGEPEPAVEKDVWLFDFASYTGTNNDPNAFITLSLDKDSEYTLSFEYYVVGTGIPSLINAAKEWQGASKVAFSNNKLTGKGTYSFTFTADHTQLIPVFQLHVPYGVSKMYMWDMKLVKTGSEENLLAGKTADNFSGELKKANLISITKMDPATLETSGEGN